MALEIHGVNVAEFVAGYIGALLWSSRDESNDSGGEPLDANYSKDDFAPAALDRIDSDCRSFLHSIGYLIRDSNFTGRADGTIAARAGHDFWLTRCGHGAGFWDGDWTGGDNASAGEQLTAAAKAFGNIDPYIGDDSAIHLM